MPDDVKAIEEGSLDVADLTSLFAEDVKDDKVVADKEEAPVVVDKDEDEEEIEEDTEDDKKEEKDKKDNDEIEIELEDDEDLTDQLPSRRDIKKEFPEFFKKFPAVEKAMFREKQYAEVFPTPADAKAAVETVKVFESFRADLMNGSIEATLSSVKQVNPKAFTNIASNLVDTLYKVDREAWTDVVSGLIQNALHKAYTDGELDKTESGGNLKLAAQWVSKHLFGTTDIKPVDKKIAKSEPNEAEQKLTRQQQEYFDREQGRAVTDVTTRVDSTLKNAIEKVIDTKDQMTSYVKSKAIEDTMRLVRKHIGDDSRFRASLQKQWNDAAKENFSEGSKDKIRRSILSKAKSLLPDVVRKVRADAMKGSATKTREAAESRDEKPIKSGRPASANSSSGSSKSGNKGSVPKGMSNMDFLLQD